MTTPTPELRFQRIPPITWDEISPTHLEGTVREPATHYLTVRYTEPLDPYMPGWRVNLFDADGKQVTTLPADEYELIDRSGWPTRALAEAKCEEWANQAVMDAIVAEGLEKLIDG